MTTHMQSHSTVVGRNIANLCLQDIELWTEGFRNDCKNSQEDDHLTEEKRHAREKLSLLQFP